MTHKTAYRGSLFSFADSACFNNIPAKKAEPSDQYIYIEDGLLIVEDGKIAAAGDYAQLKDQASDATLVNCQKKLITPGFIDTHLHANQSAIVAAYGKKLLEWLDNYVFPAESKYANPEVAHKDLNFFLDQLLKNGTTTACAYGPLFYDAADIFFAELNKRQMRFITGNTLMNHNSPDTMCLSAQENYDNAKKLIAKWHNNDRLSYCITPRFALSCSEEMLALCGSLKKEHPDVYVQTHLDENKNEIAEVQKTFSWSKNYLDVYDHYGLVSDRSVFGHCIHLTDPELQRFKETQAIMAWCPLSNNFLGSGLFNLENVLKHTECVTLGSDWGAGNALSMLAVLDDAYKVSMLRSYKLPSMRRWYLATLGSAKALHLDDKIGNFSVGKEADFIIIDPHATEILDYRSRQVDDIFELLFILMTLGDDRNIAATYVSGNCVYSCK